MLTVHQTKKILKKLNFKSAKENYIAAETRAANAMIMDIVVATFIRNVDIKEEMQVSAAAAARIAAAKKAPFWVYMKEVQV